MALVSTSVSLVPASQAVVTRTGDLGPRADCRQYQRTLSVAASQASRLVAHGALRLRPGYDCSDPFVDDCCTGHFESLLPGSPCQLVGDGQLVAYLRPVACDVNGGGIGETRGDRADCLVKLLATGRIVTHSRSRLLPLPTRPAFQGDWALPVGLEDDQSTLYGMRGVCSIAETSGPKEMVWVAFEPVDDGLPPELVRLPRSSLVTLANSAPGAPLTPWESKMRSLDADPRCALALHDEGDNAVTDTSTDTDTASHEVDIMSESELETECPLRIGSLVDITPSSEMASSMLTGTGLVISITGSSAFVRLLGGESHSKVVFLDTAALKPRLSSEVFRMATCNQCKSRKGSRSILLCENFGKMCLGAAHLHCLVPPLAAVPATDWFCDKCQQSSLAAENNALLMKNVSKRVVVQSTHKTKMKAKAKPQPKRKVASKILSEQSAAPRKRPAAKVKTASCRTTGSSR